MSFHKPCSLLESSHLVGLSRTRVYLVYTSKSETWWAKLLKKDYKHVFAVKYDGIFWVKLDYTLGWTDYDVLLYDYKDTIKDLIEDKASYQYVDVWRKPRYRSLFSVNSCVDTMKSLLGIRAWWVLTPWQLHKHCKKHLKTREKC